MDIRKVKKLIEMLEASELNEIEIKEGEETVRLVKSLAPIGHQENLIPATITSNIKTESNEAVVGKDETSDKEEVSITSGKPINSPMVGTFYAAPNPGADNFVSVGDKISEGDVLCIIEAMKMMNEVKADSSGTIKQILVDNAEPVEFGQPLFVID
tara:strand:+ start:4264 stop:4731 length:468 start_codon:yes stop_codon:yes gene_type:complete